MRTVAIALGFLVLSQNAPAATLHVPADYGTIGLAIAHANPGDEILVAAGTYLETIALDATKDGVKIHSESGPALTTIDGGFTGSVVTMTSVGSGTELIGFTVTHGGHSPTLDVEGGGIQLAAASPKIDGNIVKQCLSHLGAVYSLNGSPAITNNTIDGNTSRFGGGIYVSGGAPTITGNTIRNNKTTSGSGGGLDLMSNSAQVEDNLIQSNQSSQRGGGIACFSPTGGSIQNNHLVSNSGGLGGGVYVFGGAIPISGNVIQSNSAINVGGGLYLENGTTSLVQNNQFLNNSGVGGGIYLYSSSPTLQGNLIQDNENIHGSGGGIYVDGGSSATITQNLILRNHCAAWGGGVVVWGSSASLTGNTIVLNKGDLGGGNIYLRQQANAALNRNILSHSPNDGLDSDPIDGSNSVSLGCNDVFGNLSGNYTGLADPTGTNGNISSDPLFCNLALLDVHLAQISPCTAANAPAGCGLIGALDIGCEGPVRTETTTWGGLKALYR